MIKTKYYIITAILALILFLITNIPANIVINSIKGQIPQVKIQNVSGTLWNGSAKQITIQNKYILKNVDWSICIAHLLLAEACIELDLMYNKNPLSGQLSIDINNTVQAKDIKTTMTAQALSQIITIPMAEISGDIHIDLETLNWKQDSIPSATGIIKWNKASVTIAETAQLGDITVTLSDSEDNPINAEISNTNGQLAIAGTALLKTTADYNLNLTLTPNNKASKNLKSSLSLFAKPKKDGSFILKNNGNLKRLGLI